MKAEIELVDAQTIGAIDTRMRVFERAIAAQQTVIGQLGRDLQEARRENYELRQRVLNNDSAVWVMFDGISKEHGKLKEQVDKLRRR